MDDGLRPVDKLGKLDPGSGQCSGMGEISGVDAQRAKEELRQLNNFHFNLPGGYYRSEDWRSMYEPGETFGGFLERAALEHNSEINPEELARYSKMKLGQTPQEFFDTIDQVVKDCNLNLSLISDKTDRVQRASGASRGELGLELREMVLPVYNMLIAHGYSQQDLAG